LLRSRLLRRGLTPGVAALTLALSSESSAALSHDLLDRTVRSSMKIALGPATAQVVSASITSPVEGVLTSMLVNTFKWAGLAVLVCGLALTGVGVMARQNAGAKNEEPRPALTTLTVNAESETSAPISPENGATPKANPDGRAKDPKSQQILAKLDEPISMSFNEETPLEDVLKYVRQATTTKTYSGIPIYVDPLGLQEAEKSMTSTVRNMDLEGVPLRRTLQLLLEQLDLIYFVDDGLLYITSAGSEGRLRPAMHEQSPILQRAQKAERGELSLAEMKELTEIMKARETIMKLTSVERDEMRDHTGGSAKQDEDAKQTRDQMNLLLKEMRQLIEVLKAEKLSQKTDEGK
ncbi:MAG TPA: hypothetical protein VHS97_08395, partial [Isosphaeraceae bacterium]|nr:hypothetical protein [Isosphaeraceae bacterium]